MELVLRKPIECVESVEPVKAEASEPVEKEPNLLTRFWWWLRGRHVASEYDDYFEDVDPVTFRLDRSVWAEYRSDRPGIAYYRELTTAYELLLKRVGDSYWFDSGDVKEQFNAIHKRNCELERQLAVAEGKIEILEERLALAMKWQTAGGKRSEVLTETGIEIETTTTTCEKDSSGRYQNKTKTTKLHKQMLAAAYHENGWSLQEIADELQLGFDTTKCYISGMQKGYEVKMVQGVPQIVFDKRHGDTTWDLNLYAKLEDKQLVSVKDELSGE